MSNILTENSKKKVYFVWLVPIVWVGVSFGQYYHPGDEYGLYAVGSIAGAWIGIFDLPGDNNDLFFPLSIAFTGAVLMAIAGLGLDKFRVRKVFFAIFWLVAGVSLFLFSIFSYPNIERALSKNGSWLAYIFFAMNMGLTTTVFLSLLFFIPFRLIQRALKK